MKSRGGIVSLCPYHGSPSRLLEDLQCSQQTFLTGHRLSSTAYRPLAIYTYCSCALEWWDVRTPGGISKLFRFSRLYLFCIILNVKFKNFLVCESASLCSLNKLFLGVVALKRLYRKIIICAIRSLFPNPVTYHAVTLPETLAMTHYLLQRLHVQFQAP